MTVTVACAHIVPCICSLCAIWNEYDIHFPLQFSRCASRAPHSDTNPICSTIAIVVDTFVYRFPGSTPPSVESRFRGGGDRLSWGFVGANILGAVQTLKGSGGDLIVCEEAAYMDPQVFYEVVVPLLGMRDTALIAISTILDPSNFYTKLVDMVDSDGVPLFDVRKFELVCDACRKTKTPWRCTHMTDTMPPWLSEDKHHKIRAFLPEELVGRETMGVTMSDATKAFSDEYIELFESGTGVSLPEGLGFNGADLFNNGVLFNPRSSQPPAASDAPQFSIYTAVDPNGGGLSEYAVASIAVFQGKTVVSPALPPVHVPRGYSLQ